MAARGEKMLLLISGLGDENTKLEFGQIYEKNYRMFLTTVRSKYPDAKIVLLTGPIRRFIASTSLSREVT